jgi:hypothetical protein
VYHAAVVVNVSSTKPSPCYFYTHRDPIQNKATLNWHIEAYNTDMADLAELPCPHPRGKFPTQEEILLSKPVIEALDQDIKVLQVEMKSLKKRLESLQRKRANYASYVSPLRRLPTEILSEIIRICVDDGVDITTIAGLSARLRKTALGMATMWSKVSLRPEEIDLEDDEESRERCGRCESSRVRYCRHYYGSEEVSLLSCQSFHSLKDS